MSEGHPFKHNSANPGDVGGDFYTQKSYVAQKHKHLQNKITQNRKIVFTGGEIPLKYSSKGAMIAFHPVEQGKTQFPAPLNSSRSYLEQLGATAISRCSPTNPPSEASTFLGELVKDGLPSIPILKSWEEKTKAAQALGSEYLNVVFGWLPMINDINKMSETLRHANKVLAQYERDAGKQVRRRYEFPIERTVDTFTSDGAYPAYVNGAHFHSGGKLTVVHETMKRRWFSGAFTYYLPTGYDSRNALDRAALLTKLLGADTSPDTVWNLLPWSWAVDWISNTGDVINNIDNVANQGQIMRYGYMMEHTLHSITYKLENVILNGSTTGGNSTPGSVFNPSTVSYVTETKTRVRANPFGFGLKWDGLSPFQQSILAALGLSRRS